MGMFEASKRQTGEIRWAERGTQRGMDAHQLLASREIDGIGTDERPLGSGSNTGGLPFDNCV